MNEQSRQTRYLILIAAVLCAVIVGYNAFYVPDASVSELTVSVDPSSSSAVSSSEEYTASSIPPAVSSGVLPGGAVLSSVSPAEHSSSVPSTSNTPKQATGKTTGGKININTASAQQLSDGLSGIGETIAQRIVAYREQHGPFKSIDGLKNVNGIGDKKFADIRAFVTVGS